MIYVLLYLAWEAWSSFVLHCLENTQERMEVVTWAT